MRILADSEDVGCNRKVSFEINGSTPSTSSSTLLRPFSPLLLIEGLSRKSFSYGKLPFEPIKLTVLKLDGSSFDITVAKNPTVAQLRQGVEDAFSHLPKYGVGRVSWSHVWAQFCLSFEGQKLLHEQDSVSFYGIKDGDQLQFVRHTSISYNLVKGRSEKRECDLEVVPETSQRKQDSSSNEQNHEEDEAESCDDVGVNVTCQWSWAHLFRRLFSYHRRKGHHTSYKELEL